MQMLQKSSFSLYLKKIQFRVFHCFLHYPLYSYSEYCAWSDFVRMHNVFFKKSETRELAIFSLKIASSIPEVLARTRPRGLGSY